MGNEIQIKKIYRNEIKDFISSSEYLHAQTYPISPSRAISYLHNPRESKDKPVMYLAILSGEIVAYRTVLHDKITINGSSSDICWLSGLFVSPHHRGKSISRIIMTAFYEDYKSIPAIFADPVSASSHIYFSDGKYNAHYLKGIRIYLQKPLELFLLKKYPSLKIFLPFIRIFDWLIKLVGKVGINPKPSNDIMLSKKIDSAIAEFVEQKTFSIFERKSAEWNWIMKYPWVIQNQAKIPYHFSYTAKEFQQYFMTQRKDNKVQDLLHFSVRDGHLKIGLASMRENSIESFTREIIAFARKNNIYFITCFDKELSESLANKYKWRAIKKGIQRNYGISENVSKHLPENLEGYFSPDDGDQVFI